MPPLFLSEWGWCVSIYHSPLSGWHRHGHPASVAADVQPRAGPGRQAGVHSNRETAEEGACRGRYIIMPCQPCFAFDLLKILSNTVFPTYLCLPQCLLLRPRPSRSMPCRTASCLMPRTQSRCRPLEGAVPPARTGLGAAGTLRWTQNLSATDSGSAMAQHRGTEPEEQRLLSCMG